MHPCRCPAGHIVHAGQDDERREHRIPTSPHIGRRGAQGGGRGLVQRFSLQRNHLHGGNQKAPRAGREKAARRRPKRKPPRRAVVLSTSNGRDSSKRAPSPCSPLTRRLPWHYHARAYPTSKYPCASPCQTGP